MASIQKRNGKYNVKYRYTDESENTVQKWESFSTYAEAHKRKVEVEKDKIDNNFIPPKQDTIREFLEEFVTIYGRENWALRTYDSYIGLINNYINPFIGDKKVQALTSHAIDLYYCKLKETPSQKKQKKRSTVSDTNIERVHKLLRCAFEQAKRWEMIHNNPFDNVKIKRNKYNKRKMWNTETLRKALNACKDARLYVAMNLAFACSMREGEILGLTWDNVHISPQEIAEDAAYVYVAKELAVASLETIKTLENKDVFYIFEPIKKDAKTRTVLKTPKTESSVRKIWLPRVVAEILQQWKEAQDKMKRFLGAEYQDFNLVVSLENGRPCSERVLLKAFQKLREEAELPEVVFHSLRHSSVSYKLQLSNGNLKATQGDTGHASVDILLNVYAHEMDDDRKINSQIFNEKFYTHPELKKPVTPKQDNSSFDLQSLITALESSPELTSKIALLIQQNTPCSHLM